MGKIIISQLKRLENSRTQDIINDLECLNIGLPKFYRYGLTYYVEFRGYNIEIKKVPHPAFTYWEWKIKHTKYTGTTYTLKASKARAVQCVSDYLI